MWWYRSCEEREVWGVVTKALAQISIISSPPAGSSRARGDQSPATHSICGKAPRRFPIVPSCRQASGAPVADRRALGVCEVGHAVGMLRVDVSQCGKEIGAPPACCLTSRPHHRARRRARSRPPRRTTHATPPTRHALTRFAHERLAHGHHQTRNTHDTHSATAD